jgi:hypothetical protein
MLPDLEPKHRGHFFTRYTLRRLSEFTGCEHVFDFPGEGEVSGLEYICLTYSDEESVPGKGGVKALQEFSLMPLICN